MPSAEPAPAPVPKPDPNRIIAVVTGANSGFGLGICQALLSSLSVPSGVPIALASPQLSALAPSLLEATLEGAVMPSPHPSLTIVLACRSEANAVTARNKLLTQHRKDLTARRGSELQAPSGWESSLRIEYELVDCDALGGPRGTLAFAQRLKKRYPHVTSLYLNAGYAAFTNVVIPRFLKQILTDGYLYALHHPRFNEEKVGEKSGDGERGRVWGVNVLAPYVLAKELAPLLRASPRTLPFAPRVIYTSSIEAEAESLLPNPESDLQLLKYETSYRASKYMGDLVLTSLDADASLGAHPTAPVRCLVAEPGCVTTNIATAGFGAWAWLVTIKWACYWLAFYLAHMLGSPHHPVWATDGAAPMLYAAMVKDAYLPPVDKIPAPKLSVVSKRWKSPGVKFGEVDEWDKQADLAEAQVRECERVRGEWRRREGVE